MNEPDVLDFVAEVTSASRVTKVHRIQSLWSGYGELFRARLDHPGRPPSTVVVKWAKPPLLDAGPAEAISRARKCRSYDVETTFYRNYAPRCDASTRVPTFLGARVSREPPAWVLVFEDLDASEAGFARRLRNPTGEALAACSRWLAAFHARFFGTAPVGLWEVGTYWHLATRTHELVHVRDEGLRKAAAEFDRVLREARYQTLVHGDAKPANFCFGEDPRRVAALDFQYVGGGPGIKDVAYLLDGTSPNEHARALDAYFEALHKALPANVAAVEREWRGLYDAAANDFRRFLAGWQG